MGSDQLPPDAEKPQLGLVDAISIIVGIVIGAGIYKTPSFIFVNFQGPLVSLVGWFAAGLLVLAGALCYAELATTYPRSGGDYVYITRAFGPLLGFLFGWAQLAAILTASIGQMSYIFADYADQVFTIPKNYQYLVAIGAILAITALNLLGVVLGKWTQNLLTAVKIIGLGAIIVAGFMKGSPGNLTEVGITSQFSGLTWTGLPSIGLGMVLVLYTYGGWNDSAFVAAEVRDPSRNIPRALLFGVAIITAIYLLINVAYLMALGFEGAKGSGTIAADTLKLLLGDAGAKGMSVLVMISALGALNGLVFTGSRVYSSLGNDYGSLAWLGKWNENFGSPVRSLVIQAVVCILWVVVLGTPWSREALDSLVAWMKLEPINWGKFGDNFETLLASTAPVFWVFFLLTGLALFNLRSVDRHVPRPFAVPLYPFTPLIFCATCGYMLYSSIDYAGKLALIPFVFLLAGLPFYLFSSRRITVEQARPVALSAALPPAVTD